MPSAYPPPCLGLLGQAGIMHVRMFVWCFLYCCFMVWCVLLRTMTMAKTLIGKKITFSAKSLSRDCPGTVGIVVMPDITRVTAWEYTAKIVDVGKVVPTQIDHMWSKTLSKIHQTRANMGPKSVQNRSLRGSWGLLGGSWGVLGGSWGPSWP